MALSLTAIQEKNKLGTDSVFHILLDITIPGTPIVRITNNGDTVVWKDVEYLPFPFDISELTEEGSTEIPQWTITLDNKQRVIERYLSDYDNYLKVNGIDGNEITATLYVVNSRDLGNQEPIKSVTFELQSPSTNSDKATFVMSVSSPFRILVPKRRFIKQFCYWKFRGTECGYTGIGDTCDKSLTKCKFYNNSHRFGGFPGVGTGGVKL